MEVEIRRETDLPPIPVIVSVYKHRENLVIYVERRHDSERLFMMETTSSSALSFKALMKGRGIGLTSSPYRDANHMAINGYLVANWDEV
jgi:hypothetical protein